MGLIFYSVFTQFREKQTLPAMRLCDIRYTKKSPFLKTELFKLYFMKGKVT